MRKVLAARFFNRDAKIVARELLGKFLVRRSRKKAISAMITEVEVYDGLKDRGSHAWRGKTKRNSPMFGPAGAWYVYFTYGMHWMLNIVTREEGYPSAVLIRATENVRGPARVTKYFGINKKFNAKIAVQESGLWIEDCGEGKPKIKSGARIGISYAGPYWQKRHLRFFIDWAKPQ